MTTPKTLNNFVIFKTKTGKINIDVYFQDNNLWLTQKLMAELFEVKVPTVNEHLKNIFAIKELEQDSVIRNFRITADDSKHYDVKHYSLDAIIALGYRINSKRATQFRIWATNILNQFIIKGFVLDDERLKQIKHFGQDYFNELIERIREIRSSERRLYQKITDIYSLSADYDNNSELTKDFFAIVQNKLHFAITGKTAAEIIYSEADAKKIFMSLKSWKNSPEGKILKSDVVIAKNYLHEEHIKSLERIVSAYLDLAEDRAQRKIVMNMRDWIKFLNQILEISNYPILLDKGKITMLQAKIKAEMEYEKFRVIQDKNYESDFDREIKKIILGNKNESRKKKN